MRESAEQERWLDAAISQMQSSLRNLAEDESNAQHAYVTHEDVRSIGAFAPDTVIAIKAPSGTTLEVPDPDEGMDFPTRRYQIYLKSQSGPVEVFLVSQADGEEGMDAAAAEAAAAAEHEAVGGSGGRRGSKRSRAAAESSHSSPGSATRRGALSEESGAGSSIGHGGHGHEAILKLDPVTEADADYWNSAPSADLGIADLYFGDVLTGSGEVKVEG